MELNQEYFPIIRTIDAEIKGYEKLDQDIKELMVPIFELTRSRPLKGYPEGDIHKRMGQIEDMCGSNPFILDLTHHEDLINNQIEDLQDDTGTFREWRDFLNKYSQLNIIPVVHFYEDDLPGLNSHANALLHSHDFIALRISFECTATDLESYLNTLGQTEGVIRKLILVFDAGYVDESRYQPLIDNIDSKIRIATNYEVFKIIVASSSFPKSVTDRPGSGDIEGQLPILEKSFFETLSSRHADSAQLTYGDYGGAHPIRKSVPASGWIPRVDVIAGSTFNYVRYRRDAGGYKKAAMEMVQSKLFDAINCWGRDEIIIASQKEPSGKSPAFWISVRVNQHLTRLATEISSV